MITGTSRSVKYYSTTSFSKHVVVHLHAHACLKYISQSVYCFMECVNCFMVYIIHLLTLANPTQSRSRTLSNLPLLCQESHCKFGLDSILLQCMSVLHFSIPHLGPDRVPNGALPILFFQSKNTVTKVHV